MNNIHLSAGYDRVRKLIDRAIAASGHKILADIVDGCGHKSIPSLDGALMQAADLVLDEAATYATFQELVEFVTEPRSESEYLFRAIVDTMLLLEAPKTKVVLVTEGLIMTLADTIEEAIARNDQEAGEERVWTRVSHSAMDGVPPLDGGAFYALRVADRDWQATDAELAHEVGTILSWWHVRPAVEEDVNDVA